jgi:hypothetical protein
LFWSLAYSSLRCIFQFLVLVLRGDRSTQIEVLVLRHLRDSESRPSTLSSGFTRPVRTR